MWKGRELTNRLQGLRGGGPGAFRLLQAQVVERRADGHGKLALERVFLRGDAERVALTEASLLRGGVGKERGGVGGGLLVLVASDRHGSSGSDFSVPV